MNPPQSTLQDFNPDEMLARVYAKAIQRRARDRRRKGYAISAAVCVAAAASLAGLTARTDPGTSTTTAAATPEASVTADPPSGPPPGFRLTPTAEELPDFASDEALLAEALTVPVEQRQPWAIDSSPVPVWSTPAWSGPAVPLFTDNAIAGIYVEHLGVVERAEYDSPGFDPEIEAQERFGESDYERRRIAYWEALQGAEE
jgi:hypothetical protein